MNNIFKIANDKKSLGRKVNNFLKKNWSIIY